MRRTIATFSVLGLILSSCIAQTPPERSALPEVATVITTPPTCAFVNGPPIGANVEEVTPTSGADGVLLPDDVIIDFGGTAVATANDLLAVLGSRQPGDVVNLKALRSGQVVDLKITLGENPRTPERPLMGVMITTAYDEVPPPTSSDSFGFSPLSRMITIDDKVYAFDPETLQFAATDYLPVAGVALVSSGNRYRVDRSGAVPRLVDLDDRAIPIGEGTTPLGLLGTAATDLLLVTQGTADDPQASPAVQRISPETGASRWRWQPAEGVPVVAIASPDTSQLVVGLTVEGAAGLRFQLVSNATGESITQAGQLSALDDGVAFGWFDNNRLLVQTQGSPPALLDSTDLTLSPVELQVQADLGTRIWTIGDGQHVLVDSGEILFFSGVDASVVTRPLTRRCEIGFVDQIGSGV